MYYSSSYTEIGGASRPNSWRVPKLVLRCLSVVICWAVIAVEVSNIIEYEKLYHEIADVVYFVTPPALLAIIWDKLEFITLCVRRGRGIHPGFHVAVELILWLACSGMGVICLRAAFGLGGTLGDIYDYVNAGDDYDGPDYSYYTDTDIQGLKSYIIKGEVAGGLLALVAIIRFILFVRACVETDRRRKDKSKRPSIITTQYSEAHIPLTSVQSPQPYDPVTAFSHPPPYQSKAGSVASVAPYPQQYQYPAQRNY